MRRRKRRSASAGSIAIRTECLSWFASHAVGQIARCFYYFFMIVVVIRYKTKATARRALTFIVRIFVNNTIPIAVWTRFHVCVCLEVERSPSDFLGRPMPAHHGQLGGSKALPVPIGGSSYWLGSVNEPVQLPLAQIVQHVDSLVRCRE